MHILLLLALTHVVTAEVVNRPTISVTNLQRTVTLSPWRKSIDVNNAVDIQHNGSKLKGPFRRLHYQRDPSNGMGSVRNLVAELPKTATNIYFRDAIGNISTSTVKSTSTNTIVGLRPRFPLFGGWKAKFSVGYSTPLSQFLNEPISGNNFRLSIPFADILYENMFIEDAILKIYLPAGATNIEVKGSIDFERLKDDVSNSYLDIIGRPVITLRKRNIVSQHLDKPLVVRFDYSRTYMLQEPLLILTALVVLVASYFIKSFVSQKKLKVA